MIKMCLYLKDSQYKNTKEVETLLNDSFKMTEEQIIAIKDDRKAIEKALRKAKKYQELVAIYG